MCCDNIIAFTPVPRISNTWKLFEKESAISTTANSLRWRTASRDHGYRNNTLLTNRSTSSLFILVQFSIPVLLFAELAVKKFDTKEHFVLRIEIERNNNKILSTLISLFSPFVGEKKKSLKKFLAAGNRVWETLIRGGSLGKHGVAWKGG